MKNSIIIEPHYFPTVQFITKFLIHENVVIDDQGRYEKQTYRNRAIIDGPNNPLKLIVPIRKPQKEDPVSAVNVAYLANWPREHFQSLKSSYGKSPYFIHYEPFLKEFFFDKKFSKLLDLDLASLQLLLNLLEIESKFTLLSETEETPVIDLRNSIHPKPQHNKPDEHFKARHYRQIFFDRHPFIENLSCLDLIFNEGPFSREVLRKSIT